ncbi:MAG: type III secretion system translocon subunit SctB [Pseudomonadota bacterium]
MTTPISNTLIFQGSVTLEQAQQQVLADVNKTLKANGLTELTSLDALTLSNIDKKSDGSFSISYSYSLSPPVSQEEGADIRAFDALSRLGPSAFTDIFAVMTLFYQIAQTQRDSARESRQAELKVQVGTIQNQAQEIRDSAAAAFAGALVMGIVGIAAGMVSVAGSMKAGMQAQKGLSSSPTKGLDPSTTVTGKTGLGGTKGGDIGGDIEMVDLSKTAPKTSTTGTGTKDVDVDAPQNTSGTGKGVQGNPDGQAYSQLSATTLAKWQGWSSLGSGLGSTGKAFADREAAEDQADMKEQEAAGAASGGRREELISYQEKMQQVLGEVRQMMQQITQSQAETARTILRV